MRLFSILNCPLRNFLVGGLTADITELDIKDRFSAVKGVDIEAVDIIRREDGACKGFAYINTKEDTEESLAKLIKLFNGAKWKGKSLKVEKAKPSYLDRMAEEKALRENPQPVVPVEPAEPEEKMPPPSGIPNTIMIRKSKRKFIVISLETICRNEDGKIVMVGESSSFNEAELEARPETVSLPAKEDENQENPVSTKKHRFVQPEITCFEHTDVLDTDLNLWDAPPTPKRTERVYTSCDTAFAKSSITLESDSDDGGNDAMHGMIDADGFLTFGDDEEQEEKPRGVINFEDEESEDASQSKPLQNFSEESDEMDEENAADEDSARSEQESEQDSIEHSMNETPAKLPPEVLDSPSEEEMAEKALNSASTSCCTDSAVTSNKREWREKWREIDEKRRRVEQEEQMDSSDDEKEDLESGIPKIGSFLDLDLNQENQKYSNILEAILHPNGTPAVTITPAKNTPDFGQMGSLFDEGSAASFSLFNFLPSETPAGETPANETPSGEVSVGETPGETPSNALSELAPTAWFNEKKSNVRSKIISIPVGSQEGRRVVPHDFSKFFYRTRSMKDVAAEWRNMKNGMKNDLVRKKKDSKRFWKKGKDGKA